VLRVPPILCYHKIERRAELGVTRVSPRRFARQVERLARAGYRTLTLDELIACLRGERVARRDEIAITFDDGYRGLRDHAFPVLEAHGFAATVFIVTDFAGKLNRWDVAYGGRRFAHLAWRDMRRWQARGISFASHTASHPRLPWVDENTAARELATSRLALEGHLDVRARAIAYPFGAAGRRERALAVREGYDAGFALAARWRGDPMLAPRLPVYGWSPPVPAVSALAPIEWSVAWLTNRFAVGTSLWLRLTAPKPRTTREPAPAMGD
jgi:peptidoglycan/xylan/chitin deacetylase (PgdA/CDA1 family)